MANKKKASTRTRGKEANPRKYKKKTSPLLTEQVEYVDYKDVDLLQRFMSDRAKIRNRRVTGNDVQQQREVANAIKIAREMGLLPYTRRVASASRQRPPRDDDRERSSIAADDDTADGADGADVADELAGDELIDDEAVALAADDESVEV